MNKRIILATLVSGTLAAGAVAAATSARADSPPFGGTRALASPAAGARAAIVGPVGAVSGSTYTLAGPTGPGGRVTVTATSATTYVKADGSPADAAAVQPGVTISAEGTPSNDGKTITAQRIVVGVPQAQAGVLSEWTSKGGSPAPMGGAGGAVGAEVSAVSGSTFTLGGPAGATGPAVTVTATSATTYVKADGSPADAAAVQPGEFVTAEGTFSDDGKTLAARRVTIGRPPGGVFKVSTDGVAK